MFITSIIILFCARKSVDKVSNMLDIECWPTTVNVDIFSCIHFRVFPKIGNFAEIYIRVFDILASMLHYNSYFHDVHIYAEIR